ncbi:type II secretion system F family protein [Sporolactobacillus sp. THM7-4]|nr:type II secretion system F family protein [Sporolactobacillus sp. THM7-4]
MSFRKRWSKKEQATFLINLGRCLSDGYPLKLALQMQQFHQRALIRRDLDLLMAELREGLSLHEVLLKLRFPDDLTSGIYFAEESGELARGLIESGEMLQRREEQKETLRKLLRYPILLLWVFAVMMFIIGRFLLPNFLKLYDSLSIDLPLITQLLLYITNHTGLMILTGLSLIMLFVFTLIGFQRMPVEKRLKFLIRIPLAGSYTRLLVTHHFSFYLGSLLRSGLPVCKSLETLSEKGTTPFLRFEAGELQDALREGNPFEKVMSERPYYLPDLISVIHQGQLNGMLGQSLYRYSGMVLSKMEERTHTLISLCQPALLIFVGGLVLCLFASILLPIFHIVNGL